MKHKLHDQTPPIIVLPSAVNINLRATSKEFRNGKKVVKRSKSGLDSRSHLLQYVKSDRAILFGSTRAEIRSA